MEDGAVADLPAPLQATTDGPSPLGELLPPVLKFPGWEIVALLLILVIGVYLSKYAVRLLGRRIARRFRRQSVAQVVLRVIRVGIVLVFGAFAARVVGVELGNIVLSVTVFSAVLGIVLAPIIGSVLNGLFLLADQPYEIGDMIELDTGTRGFVEEITLRYTKVITLDNTFLVIPNATIRDRDVTNFSAEDERTRLSLPLLVTYGSDITQARRLMERAGADVDMVIEGGPDIRIGSARYPAKPTCYIDEYADHGVLLNLRYWARKPYKLGTVRSLVQERVWALLGDEGADVEIAYPHQHLYFDDTSGAMRVELEDSRGTRERHLTGATASESGVSGASKESGVPGASKESGAGTGAVTSNEGGSQSGTEETGVTDRSNESGSLDDDPRADREGDQQQ